jgi:hypothetical protein
MATDNNQRNTTPVRVPINEQRSPSRPPALEEFKHGARDRVLGTTVSTKQLPDSAPPKPKR